jgi:hypothetical protein
MDALARVWTWTTFAFIPVAFAWGVYVRGAFSEPHLGVLISWGYWGLLLTLGVSGLMAWTLTLYVRFAIEKRARYLVPPNTEFETDKRRNPQVSWATVIAFWTIAIVALVVFSVRYGESRIHRWDDASPLADGFWSSRRIASAIQCDAASCFSIASRWEGGQKLVGVNQYIPYVTDGVIVIAALPLLSCGVFVAYCILRRAVCR